MNKAISPAIPTAGVLLLIFSINAHNSFVPGIISNIITDTGIARKTGR